MKQAKIQRWLSLASGPIKLSVLAAAIVLSGTAPATDYYMRTSAPLDGTWQDPGYWFTDSGCTQQATVCPGSGDKVYVFYTQHTVTLTDDVSIGVMSWRSGVNGNITFELGGHTLELTTAGYNTYLLGNSTSALWGLSMSSGHRFRNGTFKVNRPIIGNANGNSGYLHFDNATLEGTFWEWPTASRVVLTNASTWKVDMNMTIGPGVYRALCQNGFVAAFGSSIDCGDHDLSFCHNETGLWLAENSTAAISNLWIGSSWRATNTTVRVEDSTLTVNGDLRLGSDMANPDGPEAKYRCEDNRTKGATLKISGAGSTVSVAGAIEIYDSTEALLEFTVPAAGFTATPLTAGSLVLVPRNERDEEYGPTRLHVNCYDWAKIRSKANLTLVRLDTPAAEALASLAAAVVWDYPGAVTDPDELPVLSVSADGTELTLTSPEVKLEPTFTVSTSAGAAAGQKTVNVDLEDYGVGASSIVSAKCVYADNAELTGSTEVELLNGAVSGALPRNLALTLNGSLAEWRRYYARLTLENEGGHTASVDFEFDGDGVAETLDWRPNQTGWDGVWNEASNWYLLGGAQSGQIPHAEDIVHFPYLGILETATVSLTADADILRFYTDSANYPSWSTGTLILELNGHTITGHSTYSQHNQCLQIGGSYSDPTTWTFEPRRPAVILRNGTVQFPNASQSKILVGAITSGSSGTLVLSQGARLICDLHYFQNASQFLVLEGSYFETVEYSIGMNGHTAKKPYCTFCVKDAGSRVNLKQKDLSVQGDRAGAFVLDGGRVECANLKLGGDTMWNTDSSPESVKTFILVSNATVVASGDLRYGYTRNGTKAKVNNQYPPYDLAQNPQFIVGGTNTSVTIGGTINILEEFDSVVEFQLEPEGFSATPVTANSLVITPRPTEDLKTARGLAKLVLTGTRAWARANPERSMTLLKLNTDCTAALTTLKNRLVSDSTRITAADLSVSQDGTELILTAPKRCGAMVLIR